MGCRSTRRRPQVNEVISVETARTMMQFLQAVVQHGTGWRRSQLKHPLGGKTGTTNDFTDAWFIGFSPSVTCGTWIGFDDRQSLGEKETGARAALPMWMDFMRAAIANKPNEAFAAAGAPKKKLDVPLRNPAGELRRRRNDESDPDCLSSARISRGGLRRLLLPPRRLRPVGACSGLNSSARQARSACCPACDGPGKVCRSCGAKACGYCASEAC